MRDSITNQPSRTVVDVETSGDNERSSALTRLAEFAIIRKSGLFDEAFYRDQLAEVDWTIPEQDMLAHYLGFGEAAGLKPSRFFDPGHYLSTNTDVAAKQTNALMHYVTYGSGEARRGSLALGSLTDNPKSALISGEMADRIETIAASGVFDPEYYDRQAKTLLSGTLLIKHYLEIGEQQGLCPSILYSPDFYARHNPDVAQAGIGLLEHYIQHGKREGRRGSPITDDVAKQLASLSPDRDVVLVVVHETSLTGAPILGLNICRHLKIDHCYSVVALSWRGQGDLALSFARTVDAFVQPEQPRHYDEDELTLIARLIAHLPRLKYVIANSSVVNKIALEFQTRSIPTVGLIHEFSSLIGNDAKVSQYLEDMTELVFPAEIVRAAVARDHPSLDARRTHVIPQGRSVLTGAGPSLRRRDRPLGQDYLASAVLRFAKRPGDFLVAGLGTLEWRKGLDQFISVAEAAREIGLADRVKFVWVGDYHSGSYEAALYAEEQLNRSRLGQNVLFLPGTSRIDEVYDQIDALLVVPRLDPLPNVAIDAIVNGIPVVACEGGTGVTEILARDPVLAKMIAPYMNSAAAAKIIATLVEDDELLKQVKERLIQVGRTTFDMRGYVFALDKLMRGHS